MNSTCIASRILRNQIVNLKLTRNIAHITSNKSNKGILCSDHIKSDFSLIKRTTFWEREKKSGYGKIKQDQFTMPTKKMILDGLKELKHEIKMWKDEVKEKIETDPVLVYRPGK